MRLLVESGRVMNLPFSENKNYDEARYNLATHVMSNGVELIIASDKLKLNDKLLGITSTHIKNIDQYADPDIQKPVTLAPSTLKNHMVLAVPSPKIKDNYAIPSNDNQFITKTCLTTYTYRTTFVENGTITVTSKEKVISNRHTEDRNYFRGSTELPLGVTLSSTPEMIEGIFPTTYYYYNTLSDELMTSSQYTVKNTVTGPEDYISFLQPSEAATPTLKTNTYYSRLTLRRTQEMDISAHAITEKILTQIIVTESIPSGGGNSFNANVPKATRTAIPEQNVHIFTTKTFFTTVTLPMTSEPLTKHKHSYETSEQDSGNYKTQVIENVVTNIVPSSLLKPELISLFRTELMQKKGKILITLATLVGGETLQVTAINMLSENESQTTASQLLAETNSDSMLMADIRPSSVTKQTIAIEESKTGTSEDLNTAESENKNELVKPAEAELSPVNQLIGSISLERLRPVFNVMADLLHKQIRYSKRQSSATSEIIQASFTRLPTIQNIHNMLHTNNQSTTIYNVSTANPIYIPLIAADSHKRLTNNNHIKQSTDKETLHSALRHETRIGGLAPHSLHIGPPELIYPNMLEDKDSLIHSVGNPSRSHSYSNEHGYDRDQLSVVTSYHPAALINNGIAIRPGEIISANADVVIGRPNGIDAQHARPILNIINTSIKPNLHNYNFSAQPLQKTWLSSNIPLSLTPPRLIPVSAGPLLDRPPFKHFHSHFQTQHHANLNSLTPSAKKVTIDDFNIVLRPPLLPEASFSLNYALHPANTIVHQPLITLPTVKNKAVLKDPIRGSQQILNLNSELSDNEILEIKQIPPIFSIKVPPMTMYDYLKANDIQNSVVTPTQSAYSQLQMHLQFPDSSTYSTHHHINLKTNVLNHNVNMNVPPLTFKRENDNDNDRQNGSDNDSGTDIDVYPLLAAAIRGHMSPAPMPLIKIPHDKTHVDVRLNPHNSQIAVVQHSAPLGNMNSLAHQFSVNTQIKAHLKPLTQSPANDVRHNKVNWFKPDLVTAKTKDVKGPDAATLNSFDDDQNADYTNILSKVAINSSNSSRSLEMKREQPGSIINLGTIIENTTHLTSSKSSLRPSLGQSIDKNNDHMFVKQIREPLRKTIKKSYSLKSNNQKSIFPNIGERFNLEEEQMGIPTRPQSIYQESTQKFANFLLPPPIPVSSHVTVYSEIIPTNLIGLMPPPAPVTLMLSTSKAESLSHNSHFNPRPNPATVSLQVRLPTAEDGERYGQPHSVSFNHRVNSMKTNQALQSSIIKETTIALTISSSQIDGTTKNTYDTINKIATKPYILITNSIWIGSTITTIDSNIYPPPSMSLSESHSLESSEIITEQKIKWLKDNPSWTTITQTDGHYKSTPDIILVTTKVQTLPSHLYGGQAIPTTQSKNIASISNPLKLKSTIYTTLNSNSVQFVSNSTSPLNSAINGSIYMSGSKNHLPLSQASFLHQLSTTTASTLVTSASNGAVGIASASNDRNYSSIVVQTTHVYSQSLGQRTEENHKESNFYQPELPFDYETNIPFELPTRDEELIPPIDLKSVLLGGIIFSTPSNFDGESKPSENVQVKSMPKYTNDCLPACKSHKNEVCTVIDGQISRCECRLGFARMFPDRPCKPTFTYELQMAVIRVGNFLLKFKKEFTIKTSSQYRQLTSIILDATDRMVMQSDFRDVYYGVQLKSVEAGRAGQILGSVLLQLFENSDEKRLETVLRKLLRQSNYSIGGTELYTSGDLVNNFVIKDFDECNNGIFNDCASSAQCFNLVGSYTCICPDGYADISENPIYPGRQCASHIIGCDKCNYHGHCVSSRDTSTKGRTVNERKNPHEISVCECFAWYAGVTCQLNLKILLICLILIGTVFIFLIVSMMLINMRRKNAHFGLTPNPVFISTCSNNYQKPGMMSKISNKSRISSAFVHGCTIQKQAKHDILDDSQSESSCQNSETYIFKEPFGNTTEKSDKHKEKNKQNELEQEVSKTSLEQSQSKLPSQLRLQLKPEPMTQTTHQTDRSLTVMIPRAKYYHPPVLPHHHQLTAEKIEKPQTTIRTNSDQPNINDNNVTTMGALVSAGFEVSTMVNDHVRNESTASTALKLIPVAYESESTKNQCMPRENIGDILHSSKDIQRMSSWISNIRANAVSADARSFDETTVQAVTKSMQLCFDMQAQSNTNEEANTMTERDLGSTFLLPHTHLYKTDKFESDQSGFESI
ncbi:uncharacterized protein LOC108607323 [Drosophila busckii]|uniref:uncharacterized protein LOC108607323 n=1 Tax=Drosophila busckii TaxID=30019 RepID=UPI001432A2F2|nr:uncharacterized protein LOC108607323 [Drosophila busckii]